MSTQTSTKTPYTWGLGRRKSAKARVRVRPGAGGFLVNDKEMKGTFKQVPARDEVLPDINENLVIELYSK